MKILAFECSAGPASVAVIENGTVLASAFINVKLTHSQTLLPLAKNVLSAARISFDEIEGLAIAAGPGSFTGIRIGISAVKGLAAAKSLSCVGVSTLGAMAESFRGQDCILCAVMDARCNQVYNALFRISGDSITRICDDRALEIGTLIDELNNGYGDERIIVCGDGADIFLKQISDKPNIECAAPNLKYQNAVGVALCAEKEFLAGNTIPPQKLLPVYLRLPQAERELKAKKETEKQK